MSTSDIPADIKKRFCIRCGERLVTNAAFCSRCGAPVNSPDASAASSPFPEKPTDQRPKLLILFERTWLLVFALMLVNSASQMNVLFELARGEDWPAAVRGFLEWLMTLAFFIWLVVSISRSRRRWAKWVLTFAVLAGVAIGLLNLGRLLSDDFLVLVLNLLQLVLGVFAVCLLFTPAVVGWLSSSTLVASASGPQLDGIGSSHSSDPVSAEPYKVRKTAAAVDRYGWLIWVVALIMFGVLAKQGKFDASLQWAMDRLGISNIELAVEVNRLRSDPNAKFGFLTITNLSDDTVTVQNIAINHSKDRGCSFEPSVAGASSPILAPGRYVQVATPAVLIGACGSILTVTVETNKGSAEYTITWR